MSSSRAQDLQVQPGVAVPASELSVELARSGGPGGQNVNKVATKVVLRFVPAQSRAFDDRARARVLERLAAKLTARGEIVIHSSEHRSAERNLDAARVRLSELLRRALARPKPRRPTRPTTGSRMRRLEAKRRTGETKRARRGAWD
jgi:ribosome-associated protein